MCEVRDTWDQPGEDESKEVSRQRQRPSAKGLVVKRVQKVREAEKRPAWLERNAEQGA